MVAALVAMLLAASVPSPAQHKILRAQESIRRHPSHAEGYVQLAMALASRAREVADPGYYAQAEQAVQQALERDPDSLEARKALAWSWLGRHEFARALELARELNRKAPDDVLVYGLLVDASVELGRYAEAEEAAQWMLDLRPGNVAGLARGAYLRELFGDVEGALELMEQAHAALPPDEVENRAWVLTQMAHLRLSRGQGPAAQELLALALELFPDYHYALDQLAKLRAFQGRHAEAAELQRQRYEAAPHPENLYALAVALERAGRTEQARACFAKFADAALAESESADNANHELAFYYADHAGKPAEALRVARLEWARRQDVHTRHVYAWALHASGQHAEARRQLEAALALGLRDATMLRHAGVICAALGDRGAAERYFRQAAELGDPGSETASAVLPRR